MPPIVRYKAVPGVAPPTRDDVEKYKLYFKSGGDDFLIWNREAEGWELPVKARWYECGKQIGDNRLCTKLLGHGGEHGQRIVDEPELPMRDARSDGVGTTTAGVDRR